MSREELELAISGNERRKNQRIQPEQKWIAVAGSEVVGLALVGQHRTGTLQPTGRGIVRFLGYKRGLRRAGQMLHDAIDNYARDNEIKTLTAFPFLRSLPNPSLSNHLAHIQGLLTACGYTHSQGHVRLEWRHFTAEPIPSTCPLEFRIETEPTDGDLPALRVTSYLKGNEVGVCYSRPHPTSESRASEGPWLVVYDLDIVESEQGNGFGWLTLQKGLAEASTHGYRSAVIGCNENNGRALSMYANVGFKAIDWSYDFNRDLS